MHIEHHVNLATLTTFHVPAKAEKVARVTTVDETREALRAGGPTAKILGGGSNVLVTRDVPSLLIKMEIMGRDVLSESTDHVVVRFGAGETWHACVAWCVEQGWGGLENLALIPGTVGAAPMQNIGAYGVEQDRCFDHLEAVDRTNGEVQTFHAADCAFGYRESIFKHALRDRMVITHVAYRLRKHPEVHNDYADVRLELQARNITHATIADIFHAVVAIRSRKLPDPAVIGNAGSFFKNPIVDAAYAAVLHATFPTMPQFAQPDGRVKLAAAWLIDQCGWKGYRSGDVGVHVNQALVLVNYASATGTEVVDLSNAIRASVLERFDVMLETEVNIW